MVTTVNTSTKSELLKQLTINHRDAGPTGFAVVHLIAAAVLAAVVAAASVYALVGRETAVQTPLPSPIESASTTRQASVPAIDVRRVESILNASGYITARRTATVSAEIMGLIASVEVEEGMEVKAGQVLARLDDSIARVDLQLAEAQLIAQRERINSFISDLAEAERVLKRFNQLQQAHFSSEAQRTRAEADVISLRSALASARADLRVAELQVERQREGLANHTIRAPFAGIITVKNAQPGEIVAPASAGGGYTRTGICTLVDMGSLEIEVDVNESFIGRVFAGQEVLANLDAYPDWDIPASVIAIIPTADRAKATVAVRIRIHSKDPRILPNMGVSVAFYNDDNKV